MTRKRKGIPAIQPPSAGRVVQTTRKVNLFTEFDKEPWTIGFMGRYISDKDMYPEYQKEFAKLLEAVRAAVSAGEMEEAEGKRILKSCR